MSRAAYEMEREVPGEILAVADRIWFGEKRPFQTAREAWRYVEDELERWEKELEAGRSDLARSILGIRPGDIVASQSRGGLLRLLVIGISLYPSDGHVTFVVQGIRFRKDGTLGKLHETLTCHSKTKASGGKIGKGDWAPVREATNDFGGTLQHSVHPVGSAWFSSTLRLSVANYTSQGSGYSTHLQITPLVTRRPICPTPPQVFPQNRDSDRAIRSR
ncbi:hypothetical protein [Mesorhizobium sp. M0159]|uniref:hypothetical protein n=1 Tax=Mesorhizobium sp. M0159 TaxID=2956900 RepID=UPI0033353759